MPRPSRPRRKSLPPRKPRRQPNSSSPQAKEREDDAHDERLQKILAAAGLGSRRQCEALILEGRVDVDGETVSKLGTKADPETQEIRVDGVALRHPKLLHYMVNKPTGIVSTNNDPAGRPRVIDMVPPHGERLFTVGRLDMSSEGLILVTNDGELANLLTHPRYGVEKTYHVEVAGKLEREDVEKLRKGIYLAEGFAKVVNVKIKSAYNKSTLLEIVLDEGRNREIRRLLAKVGHKVLRLKRVALGPLRLGEVPVGSYRALTRDELRKLRDAAQPTRRRPAKRFGSQRPTADKERKKLGESRGPRRPTVIGGDAPAAPPLRRKRRPKAAARGGQGGRP